MEIQSRDALRSAVLKGTPCVVRYKLAAWAHSGGGKLLFIMTASSIYVG